MGAAPAAGLSGVQEKLRWRGGDPFSLGVASGHPTPYGLMLWTRLAPHPLTVDPDMPSGLLAPDLPVRYEIAADERAPCVATEFIGASVTSSPPPAEAYAKLLGENPHVRYFDSGRNGYVSVDLTHERMAARLRVVSDVADPNAAVATLKTFVVEDGCPGAVGA